VRELAPTHSRHEIRAEVVGVRRETADTKTFELRPNRAWRGHRAGQYTSIAVEIDGVRVHRCYSISSAPGMRPISITVKRVPGGRVSSWLHDHVRPGDVLGLGPATGDFILPEDPPSSLLLLSGGSGITPVMSILRDLAGRGVLDDVVFVHHARTRADVIFGDELTALAAANPGLRLAVCLDDDRDAPRGFDEARLAALVPDFAARSTFLCGPPPMMDRATRLWADAGAARHLVREHFAPAPSMIRLAASEEPVAVYLARSQRQITVGGPGALLDQLERAGERPAHGCRIGICRTCTCRKQSGTVQNLVTGEVSSGPDEDIQLCISVPRSELRLDL
jgi:ferredoxin-NADP reductase